MKKLTILAALCALVLGSCAENNLDGVTPETAITLPDLTACFAENDTKTYVENGKYLRWHEADLITAFFGNTLNRQFKFKGKTGANSGTFSLVPSGELGTGNSLNAIYAVYPYDESTTITDEGAMTINLPAVQNYAENSFGKGANTMMAVTAGVEDTFLGFKNACGYLKLKLYGEDVTLASVEVKGNNDEKIAGSATATMEFGGVPTLAMNNDATTTVTLDCGEGIVLGATAETATELWIVLPETTFEGGITITATDTEGLVFEKSTSNPIVIARNEIQPMKALEAVFEVVIPETWKIDYTATAMVTPYRSDAFGATIVSNEWNETTGEGVITFDGEVTSIGIQAFYGCKGLTSITIPDSVTSIGHTAFQNCSSLASITIPDSVISIEFSAFDSCYNLSSINIPDSVTSIGSGAFYGCIGLTSITIPDSVTSIVGAFSCCSSLAEFKGKFASEDGRCLVVDGVFNSFAPAGLTEYTIPNNVTSIGYSAFDGCSSLTSVTIPDSVTSIGNWAFSGCSSLTSITIPDSVTKIGVSAFSGCSSLTSITIPDGVTSIGWSAFSGCSSLTSITIPDGVTSIGSGAFCGCSSLACITIPDGVTEIGSSAFERCSSLASVTIPDSVTLIDNYAFGGCSSLTSITIPESVTRIGFGIFAGCSSLAEVYCKPTTPPIGGLDMFYNNAEGRKIYVPTESVEAYKAAAKWSDYADDIVGYDF